MEIDFDAFIRAHPELLEPERRPQPDVPGLPTSPIEFSAPVPRAELIALGCYLAAPLGTGALGCWVAGPLGGAIGLFGALAFSLRLAMTDWTR